MRAWRTLSDERTNLFSPIGLLPIDDLSGRAPLGRLQVFLDAKDGGGWRPTDVRAVITQGGVIAFPALGRMRDAPSHPVRRYRVRVEAEHYLPIYRRDQEGIEFDAFPYDDGNPPRTAPGMPVPFVLVPGPTYPFPGHLMVLRGRVVDSAGGPVRDAEVAIATSRRTLSDARGVFALSAPRPVLPATIELDATDARTERVGGLQVHFPQDLGHHLQIVIS